MASSVGTVPPGTTGAVRPERKRPRATEVAASPWARRAPATVPALQLPPLIAEYTATFGSTWGLATRSKHAGDFARFITWLAANGLPATTAALASPTLLGHVEELRSRPRV